MTGLRGRAGGVRGEAGLRGLDKLDQRMGRFAERGWGLNAEKPPRGVASLCVSKLSPAVSYSPTGSPLQYHRRKES